VATNKETSQTYEPALSLVAFSFQVLI